uniref:Uncharacterized protein n=1 Tax=Rhizophora mucronata TaxID=61149 RepID=A0A2P2KNK2_RHIMU
METEKEINFLNIHLLSYFWSTGLTECPTHPTTYFQISSKTGKKDKCRQIALQCLFWFKTTPQFHFLSS